MGGRHIFLYDNASNAEPSPQIQEVNEEMPPSISAPAERHKDKKYQMSHNCSLPNFPFDGDKFFNSFKPF